MTEVSPFQAELKTLAIASAERVPALPDVPTFKEQGFDLVGGSNHVIGGPAGLPAEVVEKVSGCFEQVAKDSGIPQGRGSPHAAHEPDECRGDCGMGRRGVADPAAAVGKRSLDQVRAERPARSRPASGIRRAGLRFSTVLRTPPRRRPCGARRPAACRLDQIGDVGLGGVEAHPLADIGGEPVGSRSPPSPANLP